ncbi:hypothetical protein AVEN_113657-1 [Araneus ventricosus]|uniref:C2H2-type domain-containing protein n=1 Tax=Araneus ventricosus TaxID=182803 RepID=A0A4Y2NUZ0_ARAVE|nr:hypothetical protein AVEN_113657-1 [Araneus ventricosus]
MNEDHVNLKDASLPRERLPPPPSSSQPKHLPPPSFAQIVADRTTTLIMYLKEGTDISIRKLLREEVNPQREDDLGTGLGVVSSRAATILRSIETHPLTGRFVGLAGTLFFYYLLSVPCLRWQTRIRLDDLSSDSREGVFHGAAHMENSGNIGATGAVTTEGTSPGCANDVISVEIPVIGCFGCTLCNEEFDRATRLSRHARERHLTP